MIPAMNMTEMIIIRGQFIGILISGFLLFLVVFFARFSIRRIRIPVRLAETVPPIPKIRTKLINPNCSARMYIIRGISEAKMKFLVLPSLMSYLNVDLREKARTK